MCLLEGHLQHTSNPLFRIVLTVRPTFQAHHSSNQCSCNKQAPEGCKLLDDIHDNLLCESFKKEGESEINGIIDVAEDALDFQVVKYHHVG